MYKPLALHLDPIHGHRNWWLLRFPNDKNRASASFSRMAACHISLALWGINRADDVNFGSGCSWSALLYTECSRSHHYTTANFYFLFFFRAENKCSVCLFWKRLILILPVTETFIATYDCRCKVSFKISLGISAVRLNKNCLYALTVLFLLLTCERYI